MEFSCKNLSVFRKDERVLQDINVSVKCGEILAVIGHEVCGKTALLSTLSGRHPLFEGNICINGTDQEYRMLSRKVAFVTSHPLFLPTLTVHETIKYAGYLRLDIALQDHEKLDHIKAVEKITGLADCATLPAQLCSKFQQNCLGIASEMLLRTNILVVDEPFSGLSCNDCYRMTALLTTISRQTNTAIVISLASPIYHFICRCSSVLFLNHGQVVYHGKPDKLRDFLIGVDCPTPLHSSPAEHLMSLLGSGIDQTNIRQSVLNRLGTNGTSISTINGVLVQKCLPENLQNSWQDQIRETDILYDTHDDQDQVKADLETQSFILQTEMASSNAPSQYCRSSYLNQLKVLISRNFHNARRRILFPVSVFQNLYILFICVLVWWQPERTEETIKDRLGLFFFTVVQWAFFALLDAILTFPKEMRVILAERKNKLYYTSAFCISKTISEAPLTILQPCIYMIVIYWVANLNSLPAFFASLGVLIIDVWTAQFSLFIIFQQVLVPLYRVTSQINFTSIGLFVGAALNPPWTISVVSLGLLSMMLWGGAFCTPPPWLRWGKFASYFTYGLNALITLEFRHAEPVRCAVESMVPICNTVHSATNDTITHFPSEFVLLAQNITWSVLDDVIVLIGIGVTARVLWYIILRRKLSYVNR